MAWVFGLHAFVGLRHKVEQQPSDAWFGRRVLNAMGVDVVLGPNPTLDVPKEGATVVVANHPFGAIEGLALLDALRSVRDDVKVMANGVLQIVPEMSEHCIFVDPFGGHGASARNVAPIAQSLKWLRAGHLLVVFPAGEVSSLSWSTGRVSEVSDPPWLPLVGGMVHRAEAKVVLVFIPGRNRWRFHAAGLLHPRLRTVLLGREFLAHKGKTVELRFGKPLAYSKLRSIQEPGALTSYLRQRCYLMSMATHPEAPAGHPSGQTPQSPVAAPVAANIVAREIDGLPLDQVLLQAKGFRVVYAMSRQIPSSLCELGRLREMTFRQVGEGTGRAIDLDGFDAHYNHLLVWHESKREIAGAYRLGPTDHILKEIGPAGLYTSTLFRFGRSFHEQLGPSLELGRSFVKPSFQSSSTAIRLLWKGIGHYVAKYPKYRFLWGPVSISNLYAVASRRLIVAFLRTHAYLPSLARAVRPRNPVRVTGLGAFHRAKETLRNDIDELACLVSDLEPDRKGLPPLLRQYVRLGGRFAGFNVDPAFSDVIDGLVVVDLATASPAVLASYLPSERIEGFLDHHRLDRDSAPIPPVWFTSRCPAQQASGGQRATL